MSGSDEPDVRIRRKLHFSAWAERTQVVQKYQECIREGYDWAAHLRQRQEWWSRWREGGRTGSPYPIKCYNCSH